MREHTSRRRAQIEADYQARRQAAFDALEDQQAERLVEKELGAKLLRTE